MALEQVFERTCSESDNETHRTLFDDVKGLKMSKDRVETKISGVEVAAHIKALPQVP